jgi:hypothetical protein
MNHHPFSHAGQNGTYERIIRPRDTGTMPNNVSKIFIPTRKPVKIQNALVTGSLASSQICELRSLLKMARPGLPLPTGRLCAMVHVERHPTANESRFGRAREEGEVQMTFVELLNTTSSTISMVKEDRHFYYLTTQG